MARLLEEETAGPLAQEQHSAFVSGIRMVAMDGIGLDLPDTDENRAEFGYPGTTAAAPVPADPPARHRGVLTWAVRACGDLPANRRRKGSWPTISWPSCPDGGPIITSCLRGRPPYLHGVKGACTGAVEKRPGPAGADDHCRRGVAVADRGSGRVPADAPQGCGDAKDVPGLSVRAIEYRPTVRPRRPEP